MSPSGFASSRSSSSPPERCWVCPRSETAGEPAKVFPASGIPRGLHAIAAGREGRAPASELRSARIHFHVDGEGPTPRQGRGRVGHHLPHAGLLLGPREWLLDVRI